jgi:uncharacterized protein (DUF3820 family)
MTSSQKLTLDEALEIKMSTGKFKGLTLAEMIKSAQGFSYVKYLNSLGPVTLDEETAEAIEVVLDSFEPPKWTLAEGLAYHLPFGKHKGVALVELCNTWEGRDYLEFLAKSKKANDAVEACKAVLEGTEPVDMTLSQALACRMPYGHYKGQTLEDIQRSYTGRKYLEWAKTTCSSTQIKCALKQLFQMIAEEKDDLIPTPEDEKDRLRYGRYKGKCLKELAKSKRGRSWMEAMIKTHHVRGQAEKEFLYWLSHD